MCVCGKLQCLAARKARGRGEILRVLRLGRPLLLVAKTSPVLPLEADKLMTINMYLWWLLFLFVYSAQAFDKCLTDQAEVTPKKYFHLYGKSQDINLETSSRVTHQLSTHVFYIYIDEILGYNNSKIKINNYDDDFQRETSMFRLTDHTLGYDETPPATINLEVWISPEYNTFPETLFKECGNVAPPGRFGWFIPVALDQPIKKYYNKYIWDETIREVHWSFFLNRNLVGDFNLDENGLNLIRRKGYNKDNGQYICPSSTCHESLYTPDICRNQACAVLLAPEYSTSSFLIDQVEETKLLVKILWLGKNLKNTVNELETFYTSQRGNSKSLLIFHWFPSDIIIQEKFFINVQFKNNNYYNFTQNGIGNKYEMHRLVKLVYAKLQRNANPLYTAVWNFKFFEDEYLSLLKLYNKKSKSDTYRDIACKWMKSKPEIWRVDVENPVINIGGIFPITHSSYNGASIMIASSMAVDAVNNMKFLAGYNMSLMVTDGKCTPDTVMKTFIDFIVTEEYYNSLVGVLGPACSETVEPLAGVSKHYHVMVISYSAEGASFSDRKKYPYFFRTIGENQHYSNVYIQLFKAFRWKQVAALSEDGQKYTEYISSMQNDFKRHSIAFVANMKFSREKKFEDMKMLEINTNLIPVVPPVQAQPTTSKNVDRVLTNFGKDIEYLDDLKTRRARIIIADVVDDAARIIMCEAYKLQMTAKQGYVWFLPVWLKKTWYDTDSYNRAYSTSESKESINCTTKEMKEAITGYFSMAHAYYASDNSIMQENITVGEWKNKYEKQLQKMHLNSSDYAGFAYDAVWTYAFALKELAKSDPEAMTNLHSENTTNKLVKLIQETDFFGVSGRIKFRGGASRFSVINIMQWYDGSSHIIGNFTPKLKDNEPVIVGGELSLNDSLIIWYTKDGKIPKDGILPPPSCAVDGLARAFGVECQTAMIILNVMIAGILFMGVVVVCFYMKRKYDKKVENVERENSYLRSLGFPSRKLGEGAFGTVYGGKANLPDSYDTWTAVPVKTSKIVSTTEDK